MTSVPPDETMDRAELGRLRWRCRRGMRELDVLMMRYLERDWPRASAPEKAAFRTLVDLQDPELNALLLGRMAPDDEVVERVLERIRQPD